MRQYKTIASPSESLYKEKGSKFFGFAYPVKTEKDAQECMDELKKKYYDAVHHCYAFRLKADHSVYRYSDDGEPSNSAGPPIFGQIQSHDLTNVLIVVVRYFGGTKLGVGGLISAYKAAAKESIENAGIINMEILNYYKIVYPYDKTGAVLSVLDSSNAKIDDQQFEKDCIMTFGIGDDKKDHVLQGLSLAGIDYTYLESV